ncbi:phage tail tape measure protein, partial [Clostridiaceae bacterium]|nr:phage tail tape measure protein [Clostridiaceae bacterium]
LEQTIGNTERYIRDNVDEQGRFNREIEVGTDKANELMQMVGRVVAAYATIQTFSNVLNLSDQLTSTMARLDLMNDKLQSTEQLNDMIFLSAQRSRGSYLATADAVSKLGLMAGDAFNSSAEVIAFTEQLNKHFRIAGTEAAGIDAAMLQITQAMGSGVLRGEEYNSVLEQAPNILQTVADYLGVSVGELKDMASEGQLTATILKNALFAAADETNAKFDGMPKTFSEIWGDFRDNAIMAFQPVLERMNEIGNSQAFQEFVNNSIGSISALAGVSLELVGLLTGAAGVLADNWSWLSPVIYGVAGALAVYYGWQLAVNAINAASNALHVAMAAAQMLHAAATGSLTAATAAEIAAQNGLNASMYACPVMWLIILVIALTAVFYAAVAAVNKFAGTSISATGIICGAFMVGAAFIGNLFVTLVNFAIDTFVALWNFIAAFANFFGNVFNDPVGAIARLFFDLADTVLGILESLASAIDTVFGSNLAGAVSGWRDSLGSWVDRT